jgi:ubiquinone/menaquinone biosynthesis C-methylase UbiE
VARNVNLPGSSASSRFAADPRIRVFDRIAWIYGLLFHAQRLAFRRTFKAIQQRLGIPRKARILDIGCGTGAYISVLAEMGHEVWAVDASPRMVATARRLLRKGGLGAHAVRLSVGDPLEALDFPARRFDLVLASHVVHGLQPAQRRRFYDEARRVSRGLVLVYDYSPRRLQGPGLFTCLLEVLERSDYRRFRRSGVRELQEFFVEVAVIMTSSGSAWYLCRPRS